MDKEKRQVLIPDEFRLKPFSDNTIDYVAKNKKFLKEYLKELHQVYNTMVDFVNGEYSKREELKEYLDELWEHYGIYDGFEPQNMHLQSELYGGKEMLRSIREKSGLYKTDVFYDEVGSWQDNTDICEPCSEDKEQC